jgi:hypothetical protein
MRLAGKVKTTLSQNPLNPSSLLFCLSHNRPD